MTRLTRSSILPAFRSSRLGAGQWIICLIAVTIMAQIAKTEKPTGVFWYAFLAEKCVLRPFFGHGRFDCGLTGGMGVIYSVNETEICYANMSEVRRRGWI
jgi:hypothetical protein